MYLIPADIHAKRIIRFTVTSQFTTADDILKDWSIISKTASALLAETQALNNADQPNSGEDEVIEVQENQVSDSRSDEKAELWIDKAWNPPRRPMRSLSCNSEPLPYTFTGPLSANSFEARPGVKDAAAVLPTPSMTGFGAMFKITESPSNLLGKQVLKKLTKFYSLPGYCNQWIQCGRHKLCGPVSQGAQKHLSSSCRRLSCMSSSPVANTVEAVTAPTHL